MKILNYKGQPSELNKYSNTLEEVFKNNPPHTIAEAQAVIEKLTGIKRCQTQVGKFLKRLGLKCRKVGSIPGKQIDDPKQKEQKKFLKEQLLPELNRLKQKKKSILLMQLILYTELF